MTMILSSASAPSSASPVGLTGGPVAAAGPLDPAAAPAMAAAVPDDTAQPAVLALPLFAQLLNLADLEPAAAPIAAVDDGDGQPADGESAATPAPSTPLDPGIAMPAMAAPMLMAAAVPLAPPLPMAAAPAAAPGDGTGSAPPRVDAVGAGAVLSGASTRLNLAASGVAVTPPSDVLPSSARAPAPAILNANANGHASPAYPTMVPAPVAAASADTTPGVGVAPTPAPAPRTSDAGYASTQLATQYRAAYLPPTAGSRATATETGTPASAAEQPVAQADGPAPRPGAAPAPVPALPAMNLAPAAPGTGGDVRAPEMHSVDTSGQLRAADTQRTAEPMAPAIIVKDETVPRATPTPATVNGGYTPPTGAAGTPPADSVKLAGTPEQWQQPLREALGERLQLQLQRNNEHAVIRLDPPNMGRVEISIRHTAGALQVNLSASNSEVLRQLGSIGEGVRQDLSQRQFGEVAVTVSAAPRGAQADADGRGRQGRAQDDNRGPGRALSDDGSATFAMLTERE